MANRKVIRGEKNEDLEFEQFLTESERKLLEMESKYQDKISIQADIKNLLENKIAEQENSVNKKNKKIWIMLAILVSLIISFLVYTIFSNKTKTELDNKIVNKLTENVQEINSDNSLRDSFMNLSTKNLELLYNKNISKEQLDSLIAENKKINQHLLVLGDRINRKIKENDSLISRLNLAQNLIDSLNILVANDKQSIKKLNDSIKKINSDYVSAVEANRIVKNELNRQIRIDQRSIIIYGENRLDTFACGLESETKRTDVASTTYYETNIAREVKQVKLRLKFQEGANYGDFELTCAIYKQEDYKKKKKTGQISIPVGFKSIPVVYKNGGYGDNTGFWCVIIPIKFNGKKQIQLDAGEYVCEIVKSHDNKGKNLYPFSEKIPLTLN